MKVFGYTDSLDLFEINISEKELAARGIDPWRLDLNDPNPLTCRTTKGWLHFRRLRDFCFADSVDGRQIVVGMHDGNEQVCLAGQAQWDATGIRISNPITCNERFAEHFASYLLRLNSGIVPFDRFYFPGPFYPQPYGSFQLKGNLLTIPPGQELAAKALTENTLVGTMFEERQLPIELPKPIAVVFELFGKHTPIVVGKALRDVLTQRKVDLVEVILPRELAGTPYFDAMKVVEDMPDVNLELVSSAALSGSVWRFSIGGCSYHLTFQAKPIDVPAFLRELPSVSDAKRFSVQGLYAYNAREVRGTRIAFSDLGQGKMRAVSKTAIKRAYHHSQEELNKSIVEQSLTHFSLLLPNRRACEDDGLALVQG